MSSMFKPVMLLDGGLGTSLEDEFNVKFSPQTPLWSSDLLISDPAKLLACQTAFASAGADIILTATYQASAHGFAITPRARAPEKFSGYSEDEAISYMRSAVQIARQALHQGGRAGGLVALSLGAYGATMQPSTEYSGAYDAAHQTVAQLLDFHASRLMGILDDKPTRREVDLLAFETLPRIEEVHAVRMAASMVTENLHGASIPFWVSCVFPGDVDASSVLPDGTDVSTLIRALLAPIPNAAVPDGIGINCTKLDKLPRLIAAFEAAVGDFTNDEPPVLVLYPDGTNGEVYNTTTQTWVVPSGARSEAVAWDERLFNIVCETQQRGVWRSIIVGGCCKASAGDIARLRERIDGEAR